MYCILIMYSLCYIQYIKESSQFVHVLISSVLVHVCIIICTCTCYCINVRAVTVIQLTG